jgi:hypothetical protein
VSGKCNTTDTVKILHGRQQLLTRVTVLCLTHSPSLLHTQQFVGSKCKNVETVPSMTSIDVPGFSFESTFIKKFFLFFLYV